MSRKKPAQPVILGPDGKPYVAPPKPKPEAKAEAAKADSGGSVIPMSFKLTYGHGGLTLTNAVAAIPGAPKDVTLATAVAAQVAALTATFDGEGGEELPKPPRDLTAYADAFASAVAKCQHPDAEDTMHSRGEFYCPDCRRYIDRSEYRKTRGFGGLFGW